MKYMGSKSRIAKELLPIILKNKTEEQYYVEPFAGGMNMIDKVKGKRIANDSNEFLIAMWRALTNCKVNILEDNSEDLFSKSKCVFPEKIDKQMYSEMRDIYNNEVYKKQKLNLGPLRYQDVWVDIQSEKYGMITKGLVGWVGFMASANGMFFNGGYNGTSNTKTGAVRDYISESIKNIKKQTPNLIDVEFSLYDYRLMYIPLNSIVYCDPPYKGTKKYSKEIFDYDIFWEWCRNKSNEGYSVFISEYEAPEDFTCIWEREVTSSLRANSEIGGSKKSTEKLFIFKK